ncbi:hypothetical protein FFY77_08095 [Xanthomonas translucens pv. translucens]|nr:hypothetical protein [Xanthomonas translucens pv. translucens]
MRIALLHLPQHVGTLLSEPGDAVAKVAGAARQQRQALARRLQCLGMRVFQFVGMAPGDAGGEAAVGVLQVRQQRRIQIRRGSGRWRCRLGLARSGALGVVGVVDRAGGGGRMAKQRSMRQRRSAVQSKDRTCLAPGQGPRALLVRADRAECNRLVLLGLLQQCSRPGEGLILRCDQFGFERAWLGSGQLVVSLPPCRGSGRMRDGFGHAWQTGGNPIRP